MGRRPDWLVIGTPKSGTTSLAGWLRQHPDVFVTDRKEVGFFDARFDRGLGWYEQHFADAGPDQVAGEATPTYLYDDQAIARIAATVPDARLVVLLREPVARAWSHLWFFRLMGIDGRDPAEVLRAELADPRATMPGPWPFGYLGVSRYVDRLELLARHVDRDRVRVLFFEELRDDPDGALAEVCTHLGVSPVPAPRSRSVPGSVPRSFRVQRALLRAGGRVPRPVTRAVWRLNRGRTGYPPIPEDLEVALRAAVADDNARLAAWLGRPLPDAWG